MGQGPSKLPKPRRVAPYVLPPRSSPSADVKPFDPTLILYISANDALTREIRIYDLTPLLPPKTTYSSPEFNRTAASIAKTLQTGQEKADIYLILRKVRTFSAWYDVFLFAADPSLGIATWHAPAFSTGNNCIHLTGGTTVTLAPTRAFMNTGEEGFVYDSVPYRWACDTWWSGSKKMTLAKWVGGKWKVVGKFEGGVMCLDGREVDTLVGTVVGTVLGVGMGRKWR